MAAVTGCVVVTGEASEASEILKACAEAAVQSARDNGDDPRSVEPALMAVTADCMEIQSQGQIECRTSTSKADIECLVGDKNGVRVGMSTAGAVRKAILGQ
jgi:hypothetical protein